MTAGRDDATRGSEGTGGADAEFPVGERRHGGCRCGRCSRQLPQVRVPSSEHEGGAPNASSTGTEDLRIRSRSKAPSSGDLRIEETQVRSLSKIVIVATPLSSILGEQLSGNRSSCMRLYSAKTRRGAASLGRRSEFLCLQGTVSRCKAAVERQGRAPPCCFRGSWGDPSPMRLRGGVELAPPTSKLRNSNSASSINPPGRIAAPSHRHFPNPRPDLEKPAQCPILTFPSPSNRRTTDARWSTSTARHRIDVHHKDPITGWTGPANCGIIPHAFLAPSFCGSSRFSAGGLEGKFEISWPGTRRAGDVVRPGIAGKPGDTAWTREWPGPTGARAGWAGTRGFCPEGITPPHGRRTVERGGLLREK